MAQTETQTQGNPPGNPGGTPSSSQGSDFDKLLNEFEQQKQPKAPEIPETIKPVVDWAAGQMHRQAAEAFEKDKSEAVKYLRESDPLKPLPDLLIEGALHAYANQHKDFDNAFRNRESDRKAWETARAKAREDIAKLFNGESKGSDVRSDIEAATAAVRNSQSTPGNSSGPSPEQLLGYSDAEWEAHKARRRAGA